MVRKSCSQGGVGVSYKEKFDKEQAILRLGEITVEDGTATAKFLWQELAWSSLTNC